jgi:hypothetical protein
VGFLAARRAGLLASWSRFRSAIATHVHSAAAALALGLLEPDPPAILHLHLFSIHNYPEHRRDCVNLIFTAWIDFQKPIYNAFNADFTTKSHFFPISCGL